MLVSWPVAEQKALSCFRSALPEIPSPCAFRTWLFTERESMGKRGLKHGRLTQVVCKPTPGFQGIAKELGIQRSHTRLKASTFGKKGPELSELETGVSDSSGGKRKE